MDNTTYWRRTKNLMIAAGTLPVELVPLRYRNIYKQFHYIPCFLHFLFILTLLWGVIYIYVNKIPYILAPSVSIFITYTMANIKALLFHSKLRDTIIEAARTESYITSIKDEAIENIIKRYSSVTTKLTYIYTFVNPTLVIMFMMTFFVEYTILWNEEKAQRMDRLLPYHYAFLPFNKYDHYLTAFALQTVGITLTSMYFVSGGSLIICLITQVSVRLEILQHVITNIDKYAANLRDHYKLNFDEALFVTSRLCIQKHQAIMSYVHKLNSAIKYLILVEFLTNSLQLAATSLTIMNYEPLHIPYMSYYLFQRTGEIMVLHYSANELKMQSLALSSAIFHSKWFEFDKKNKDMFRLMLLCSQKPLYLTIGPFSELSLETAVTIFKSAYTVITFVQRKNTMRNGQN